MCVTSTAYKLTNTKLNLFLYQRAHFLHHFYVSFSALKYNLYYYYKESSDSGNPSQLLPRAHAQGVKQLVLSVCLSVVCRRHKNCQISSSKYLCVP